MEFNGKALADLADPKDPTKVMVKKGAAIDGFAQLTDDGSTVCGCWLYSGAWTEKGNMMARRDNSDPSGLGNTAQLGLCLAGQPARPLQPRLVRPSGKPWDPKRKLIGWDGSKWGGADVPDFKPDSAPGEGMNPFIMTAGRGGAAVCLGQDGGRAFPRAL